MQDTHVYEVLPGEIVFRRSGSNAQALVRCKVVVTRANMYKLDTGHFDVFVSLPSPGFERLTFTEWFADWTPEDNVKEDKQAGRRIEVAVERTSLHRMFQIGLPLRQNAVLTDTGCRAYGMPLVAVLVDGRWVEPLPPGTR